jgi:hypothetical protein
MGSYTKLNRKLRCSRSHVRIAGSIITSVYTVVICMAIYKAVKGEFPVDMMLTYILLCIQVFGYILSHFFERAGILVMATGSISSAIHLYNEGRIENFPSILFYSLPYIVCYVQLVECILKDKRTLRMGVKLD